MRFPDQTKALVAIVNATVGAPLLKTTLLNSGAFPGRAANVIVWSDDELNVTVAVPIAHDADVEAFVQDPEMVHDSEPNAMYDPAADMLTFPVMTTGPEVESSAPPARVRLPLTVNGLVPFVTEPELRLRAEAVSWDD